MLRGIAVFSTQGFLQAAITIAALSLAALMLPPLSYLASGVIVLCTLSAGPKAGIKVIATATVIFTLLAGLLLKQFYISGLFLVSTWLPIFGATLVLGYPRSLAVSFLVAGAVGILFVITMHLMLPDPVQWWQQLMTPMITVLEQQPDWQLNPVQTQELLIQLSGFMTGLVAAGFTMNIILGLIIGRAWQANLYNPGSFATEFQQLYLGKVAAVATAVVMMLTVIPLGENFVFLKECMAVMLVVFAVQGLAVIHSVVKQQQRSKAWLITMYVLLVVMMIQMVVLLGLIGVLEQWFNFRRRSAE